MPEKISFYLFITAILHFTVFGQDPTVQKKYIVNSKIIEVVLSANKPVSGDQPGIPHIEPYLAVDTLSGTKLLGCSITFDSAGNMTSNAFISDNYGKSWKRKRFPDCTGDPWVAVSPRGVWYFSCLGRAREKQQPFLVYRSVDRGNSWIGPVSVPYGNDGSFDRPSLAVDPLSGRVYAVATQSLRGRDSSVLFSPVVSWSDDNGVSFTVPKKILMSNVWSAAVNPAMLSDGTVIISFVDYAVNGSQIKFKRTWAVTLKNREAELSLPYLVSAYTWPGGPWMLAAGRSNDFLKDRLYMVSTEISDTAKYVVISYSQNGGKSWSKSARVNDIPLHDNFYATPAVAVNDRGVVGVTWFDRQKAGECWKLYFSASFDGGKTFLPATQVSTANACPDSAKNIIKRANGTTTDVGFRWPSGGDYSGLSTTPDGAFHILWSDHRTGIYQLWYTRVLLKQ